MLLLKIWIPTALLSVIGLMWFFLSDSLRPTVTRPATPVEQRQTTEAMTGWGAAFASHK